MSAPGEHKPTGLVSGSQCPREQSPSAETKRGWLRCHLHHKGRLFYLNRCLCAALHITSISDSGSTWHLPFVFCPSLTPLPFHSFSLTHTVCPPRPISTAGPPPPPLCSSVETSFFSLHQHWPFSVSPSSYVLSAVCIIFSRYKKPLTHLLSFLFSPLALAGCISARPARRHTRQKAPSPAVRP